MERLNRDRKTHRRNKSYVEKERERVGKGESNVYVVVKLNYCVYRCIRTRARVCVCVCVWVYV